MAWKRMDVRDQRVRFVVRANQEPRSLAGLCQEFGISRPTGYLWLKRYQEQGLEGVWERSRRPHQMPSRTEWAVEAQIVELRRQRPDWGARKLQVLLARRGVELPVVTIHRVLLRQGLVREQDRHRPARERFEREAPNELWQMDFKSPKGWNQAIGPLSVLDDHSRYAVVLQGTWSSRCELVREQLESAFARCGMPADGSWRPVVERDGAAGMDAADRVADEIRSEIDFQRGAASADARQSGTVSWDAGAGATTSRDSGAGVASALAR